MSTDQLHTRNELHAALVEALGSPFVYYEPPASTKLHYPCIVYNKLDYNTKHADNKPYKLFPYYNVIVISPVPDDPASEKVAMLSTATPGRRYTADNLFHDPYTIHLY